jgi:hypothetical protein
MTPDQLKVLFDTNAFIIMFAWGLICKYVPLFAKIPNGTIPWINAIGYIVAKFVIPAPAHAGGISPDQAAAGIGLGGVILGSFANAVWARQLYEGFGRFLMEGVFKRQKAA